MAASPASTINAGQSGWGQMNTNPGGTGFAPNQPPTQGILPGAGQPAGPPGTMQMGAVPAGGAAPGSSWLQPTNLSDMFAGGVPQVSGIPSLDPTAVTQAMEPAAFDQFNQQDRALQESLGAQGIYGGYGVGAMQDL